MLINRIRAENVLKYSLLEIDGSSEQGLIAVIGDNESGKSSIGEEPMIRGVDETAAALKEVIGFGYTELVEPFYLAQREITTPHPRSFAVKALAGVDALEN
jgi:hypothetical protein